MDERAVAIGRGEDIVRRRLAAACKIGGDAQEEPGRAGDQRASAIAPARSAVLAPRPDLLARR